jgi:hypothetical protein
MKLGVGQHLVVMSRLPVENRLESKGLSGPVSEWRESLRSSLRSLRESMDGLGVPLLSDDPGMSPGVLSIDTSAALSAYAGYQDKAFKPVPQDKGSSHRKSSRL